MSNGAAESALGDRARTIGRGDLSLEETLGSSILTWAAAQVSASMLRLESWSSRNPGARRRWGWGRMTSRAPHYPSQLRAGFCGSENFTRNPTFTSVYVGVKTALSAPRNAFSAPICMGFSFLYMLLSPVPPGTANGCRMHLLEFLVDDH